MKQKNTKVVVMPFFFLHGGKIVKLIETDVNVSIAMDLLGNRFPVATKHLEIMPTCKNEVCTDLSYCSCQNRESINCKSYFCFDYKKLDLSIVV